MIKINNNTIVKGKNLKIKDKLDFISTNISSNNCSKDLEKNILNLFNSVAENTSIEDKLKFISTNIKKCSKDIDKKTTDIFDYLVAKNAQEDIIEFKPKCFFNGSSKKNTCTKIKQYEKQRAFYVLYLGVFNNKHYFKFGRTIDFVKRYTKHCTTFSSIIDVRLPYVCYFFTSKFDLIIEREVKFYLKVNKFQVNKRFKNGNNTEIFILNEQTDYTTIMDNIKKIADTVIANKGIMPQIEKGLIKVNNDVNDIMQIKKYYKGDIKILIDEILNKKIKKNTDVHTMLEQWLDNVCNLFETNRKYINENCVFLECLLDNPSMDKAIASLLLCIKNNINISNKIKNLFNENENTLINAKFKLINFVETNLNLERLNIQGITEEKFKKDDIVKFIKVLKKNSTLLECFKLPFGKESKSKQIKNCISSITNIKTLKDFVIKCYNNIDDIFTYISKRVGNPQVTMRTYSVNDEVTSRHKCLMKVLKINEKDIINLEEIHNIIKHIMM